MNYTNLIDLLESYWALITVIVTSLGALVSWWRKRQSSTLALYDKMDELKLKVIAQVSREINLVEESAKLTEEIGEKTRIIAEKNRIIEEFKTRCPDCYNQFMHDTK